MTQRLILVGNSADFIDPTSHQGPAWEHQLLLREPGCHAIALDQLASAPNSRLPFRHHLDLGQIWRLARALRGADAVLAQSEPSGYLAALALGGSLSRTPLRIIFHGHGWWTRRNRTLARLVRHLPNVRFLCLSSALRDLVIREYRIPADRVSVTGYGADATYFQPEPAPRDGPVVSAGTASRDYRTLATAAAGLDARFRIAADSNWYREPLNLDPAAAPANLEIHACRGYGELRALYASARIVVVPLLDRPFAAGYAVIAEAMAMGRPVIATRTACPSDLIADGVSGLHVPPNDPDALRAAIARLLADPDLAARMGAAGRARVEQDFSLTAYVDRLRASF